MTNLSIGDKIPAISFTTNQSKRKLSDFKGKKIVLYFYPKDNTPGCSTEAQDFRDLHKKFNQANAIILGVSRDSLTSHQKFIDKFEIPFELISDEDESLCQLFDVIKMKNMYGKKYLGIERSTFLIDEKGRLQKEWRKVKVKGHAEEVLSALSE